MTKIVDDDRARQAKPGRPVLYVLAASLLLAGVYLATMVGWSGVTSPSGPEQPRTEQGGAPASPAPAGGSQSR